MNIQKIDQVIGSRFIESLITNSVKFRENAFDYWKPVKLYQKRRDMISFFLLADKARCVILDALKILKE